MIPKIALVPVTIKPKDLFWRRAFLIGYDGHHDLSNCVLVLESIRWQRLSGPIRIQLDELEAAAKMSQGRAGSAAGCEGVAELELLPFH